MLSGEFETLPISSIIVNRLDRIRREVRDEDVFRLAGSIKKRGLLHPIVVNRDRVLVAGETRLRACKSLGQIEIKVQYEDSLDKNDLLAIEYEENCKRVGLDWKDECDALRRLHELKQSTNPGWTRSDTAREIGFSPAYVTERLDVAKELASGNAALEAAPRMTTAKTIVARVKQRREADTLSTINFVEKVEERKSEEILVEDFLTWAPCYEGKPFNFIHMDPPYGINFNKTEQGSIDPSGKYEDSPEVYWNLINTLLENREALMGSSCHLMLWFSMNHYQATLDKLQEVFNVDPYPLIWFKSCNTGVLPDYRRYPRRVYETAFLCSFGDRFIASPVANTFSGPIEKIVGHSSEKSETMLKHFFRMFVDTGTGMLDPTAGSGSALRAAKALGAESVLGLEINEVFAREARSKL